MSEKFNYDLQPGSDRLYWVADQMHNILNEILVNNLLDENKPYTDGIKDEIGFLLDYICDTNTYVPTYGDKYKVTEEDRKKHIMPDNLSLDEIRKWLLEDNGHDTDA